jgi:hypothetical protein
MVWKISSHIMTSAWTSMGTMWKNRELMTKHMCAFLVTTYLRSLKKNGKITFWLILIINSYSRCSERLPSTLMQVYACWISDRQNILNTPGVGDGCLLGCSAM